MVTADRRRLHLRKDNGLVKDVFQAHHMLELRGNVGLGHCRYPTAGSSSCAEAQPLYTNYPYGICVAHNGNLTNTDELTRSLRDTARRHVNTDSDSELLLNIFADHLNQEHTARITSRQQQQKDGGVEVVSNQDEAQSFEDMKESVFAAMTQVMQQCKGGYAGLYLINGFGLVGFRDPHGIRPLVFGCRKAKHASAAAAATATKAVMAEANSDFVNNVVDSFDDEGIPQTPAGMEEASRTLDFAITSESVAIDTLGFQLIR